MSNELAPVKPGEPTPEEVLAPGYYACQTAVSDFVAGDLVYLLEDDGLEVDILRGEHQWTMKRPAFVAHFAFDPEGITHRAAEMAALMAEIASLQQTGVRESAALRSFNPHVDEGGGVEGMALVPAAAQNAVAAKRSIALMRNAATRLRSDLESRQKAIKAFAEEQAIILRKQASELQAILSVAEEAVWTINLYLGEDEEIYRLAEGAPAPADTPITIRQLVLYMDEECAVAANEGGIDARDIDAFDEWLTEDPAHLAQVFPEQKGMVALKPRRSRKEYGDPWVNKALNEANRKTYFLLRNGENLFRMWTNYEVSDRLIPRTDEFLAFFTEREHNWDTGEDTYVQLKPGSAAFMKAEKAAESHKRHYMRAALILQGLIDRTPVFQPLAWKINVGDQASYVEALQVVLDADLMLSDGRERFKDWFRRINSDLTVGQRIVGAFGSYEHGLRQYDAEKSWGHRNERISPNGAGCPDDKALYTLEEKRGHGFVFFFKRSGERWIGYDSAAYQNRASCLVESGDKFILNFDAATVEEMEFYLRSRLDRSDYSYLFPTLKLAIKMKRAETEVEGPFRLLLAGEIAKAHKIDVATATESVAELVRWWKFKNRIHQALTADDAKAIRMIVTEYGHRAAQSAIREGRADEAPTVLAAILAAEPTVLLVAHKSGPEYVALVPSNDENVFVTEQIWTARGRKEARPWRVVDNRHERWQVLHTSSRWTDWKVGAIRAEHLTDEERAALIAATWVSLRTKKVWRNEAGTPRDTTPLVAAVLPDGGLELFFADGSSKVPSENLLSNHVEEPPLGEVTVKWKRDARRNPVVEYLPEHHVSVDVWASDRAFGRGRQTGMPWDVRYDGKPYAGKILWRDDDAIAVFRDALAEAKMVKRQAERLRSTASTALDRLNAQYAARVLAEAKTKFDADYGDPDLWDGHLKTLKLVTHFDAQDLRRAIDLLVERDVILEDMSVEEILAAAAPFSDKTLKFEDETLLNLRVETKTP